jgi:predicted dehydrogenase
MPDKFDRSLVVIGCGAVIDRFYMPALRVLERDGWSLGFLDAAPDRARALASQFKGSLVHSSIADAAAKSRFAIVATPPADHYQTCSTLIDSKVHILCEKPLVLDPSQALDLARKAGNQVRFHVNQTRRWFPASGLARRAIADGRIGQVRSVMVREGIRFSWPARSAFHSQVGLQRNGILSDQGSHVFDLVGWILGTKLEPVAVRHDGYAGPEITVQVDFAAGAASGAAILTWLTSVPYIIKVVGDRGELVVDGNLNRIVLGLGGSREEIVSRDRVASYEDVSLRLVGSFVSGDGNPSIATPESVAPSIEFLDRCYSIGQAVLPLVTATGRA